MPSRHCHSDVISRHFRIKGCIAWNKRLWGLGYYLRPQWEMIYLCAKGKPQPPAKAPGDIWEAIRLIKTRHPCEKPVELMRRAIRLTSSPLQIICDPFAGIGSTGVAAMLEGRRFVGSEIDGRHALLAGRRIEEAANERSD
jgi:DNA modification methylase